MKNTLVDQNKMNELFALTMGRRDSKPQIPKIEVDYRAEIDDQPNPNYGGFALVKTDKDPSGQFSKTFEPLGKSIDCVIFKRRNIAKNFDDTLGKSTIHTKEFDSWTEPLRVYNSEGVLIEESGYQALKARHGLKPSLILYVWFRESIHRLQLSASSMFSFGDYEKFFAASPMCLVVTKIGTKKEKKGTTTFFIGTFAQEAEFEFDKAMEIAKGLDEGLREYESNRDAKLQERAAVQHSEVIEGDDEGAEYIDISKLPF